MARRKSIHRTESNTPKAIGYVRVSTEGQAVDGVSLAQQREKIEAWAALKGFELVAVHTDAGISGKRADNRPGLQAAIADACRHKGAVVVYSLSRLARSTLDAITICERLDGCGADLVSISENIDTTSGMGRFAFRLMASLGELERDQISERTTAALGHKRRKGERVSRFIPYGYGLDGDGVRLIPNVEEQHVLARIVRLRKAGESYGAIAEVLNGDGITSKSGGRWHAKVVMDICNRASDPSFSVAAAA